MKPVANPENIVVGENYRITVLTERLIRLEYSSSHIFEDRPTQIVWNRNFEKVNFQHSKKRNKIEIITPYLHLKYDGGPFCEEGLCIEILGTKKEPCKMWRYGQEYEDLKGTARTLDGVDGEIPLERGIISQEGYSLLDDSCSHIITPDGGIEARRKDCIDIYFFGYGHYYKEAVKDFYRLCGPMPLLPRFALGNWWSRFYKYTEESYLQLMKHFRDRQIPLSVAVIDMDWHLVEIDKKYGTGWTGYTWNKKFFPNPKRFLKKLQEMGLKVSLNVHPAEGVHAHEEAYPAMAKELKIDYHKEQPIAFDVTDSSFMSAYFKYLHHPQEEIGVDFWWIDWQQGTESKLTGLDPLWILNHYHYMDSMRKGKRGLILSRFAGPGSHRYPVGFSGDAITTWQSLQFQPYFTATASNIGYGWWSHDIGGHMLGYKDEEMMIRWVQFGVFSPILRLHSTSSEFYGKEPWRFKRECEEQMTISLQFRHRLIPYLYSMNYRCFSELIPLILPMYYEYPETKKAYRFKNQYFFGTELLVAPITEKAHKGVNRASVRVWLPKGTWYDIFTGLIYRGGRELEMYRDEKSIPVLAKAGAILMLSEDICNDLPEKNPSSLEIKVFAGEDGEFILYEDDNESLAYEKGVHCKTAVSYSHSQGELRIDASEGETSLIPERRRYTIELIGFQKQGMDTLNLEIDKVQTKAKLLYQEKNQSIRIMDVMASPKSNIVLSGINTLKCAAENNMIERMFEILDSAEIPYAQKDEIYDLVVKQKDTLALLRELNIKNPDRHLKQSLVEIITAFSGKKKQ